MWEGCFRLCYESWKESSGVMQMEWTEWIWGNVQQLTYCGHSSFFPKILNILNPYISMKSWDISIFSLLVYRESPNLSPNRAIILIRLVVENPLVVEDQPYFLGEALRLPSSLTIRVSIRKPSEAHPSFEGPYFTFFCVFGWRFGHYGCLPPSLCIPLWWSVGCWALRPR